MKKPRIALKFEADYNPTGWLGPLCRNNLFLDCSAPEKMEKKQWEQLCQRLRELTSTVTASNPGLHQHYY